MKIRLLKLEDEDEGYDEEIDCENLLIDGKEVGVTGELMEVASDMLGESLEDEIQVEPKPFRGSKSVLMVRDESDTEQWNIIHEDGSEEDMQMEICSEGLSEHKVVGENERWKLMHYAVVAIKKPKARKGSVKLGSKEVLSVRRKSR